MFFLVAALLLMGMVLGTVAHAPVSISIAAGIGIAVWLGIFAIRERNGRRRRASVS